MRLSVRPKLEDVPIARYEIVETGGRCAFDNFVIVRIILHYRQSFRGLNAICKAGEVISEGVDIRFAPFELLIKDTRGFQINPIGDVESDCSFAGEIQNTARYAVVIESGNKDVGIKSGG